MRILPPAKFSLSSLFFQTYYNFFVNPVYRVPKVEKKSRNCAALAGGSFFFVRAMLCYRHQDAAADFYYLHYLILSADKSIALQVYFIWLRFCALCRRLVVCLAESGRRIFLQ
jgi:hypothetical protein